MTHTKPITLIYGGSFDPPHLAHYQLPIQAADRIGAEKVLYVPAGNPPHKQNKHLTAGHHRLAMLQLLLDDNPRTDICRWELDRNTVSWTVDTLEYLHRTIAGPRQLRLLIGADMALMFDRWHAHQRVAELAPPMVMLRPPTAESDLLDQLPADQRRWWQQRIVHVDQQPISSTDIRHALTNRQWYDPALAYLPPSVLKYIKQHHLYYRDM